MSNHHPVETEPGVYRCWCGFYGITTAEGIHVVESGDGRQLHLAAISEQQLATRAMVEQQIRRLIWLYQESLPIPGPNDDVEWRPSPPLTMRQVRQLGKYIKAEHGL